MLIISTASTAPAFSASSAMMAIIILCAVGLVIWNVVRHRSAQSRADATSDNRTAPPVPAVESVVAMPPAPVAAASAPPSDTAPLAPPVTLLKGLGPKAAVRLAALGITTTDQLAGLSPAQVAALDAQMGSFAGRITRDRWIEQAQLLSAGDKAAFEAAFGKLGD